MTVRGAVLAAVTAAVLVGCATVPRLEEQSWLRARSEHFEVLSSAPRPFTTRLVRDLERFHATLRRVRGVEWTADRPTRVIVFGDEATFSKFRGHGASWSSPTGSRSCSNG